MVVAFILATVVLVVGTLLCFEFDIVGSFGLAIAFVIFFVGTLNAAIGPTREGVAYSAPGWEVTRETVQGFKEVDGTTVVVTNQHDVRWLPVLPEAGDQVSVACGKDLNRPFGCVEENTIVHWYERPASLWWAAGAPFLAGMVEFLFFFLLCRQIIRSSPHPFARDKYFYPIFASR